MEKMICKVIMVFFLVFSLMKIWPGMIKMPFHDYDEANRAEGARNMKKYNYWLAPVSGSPFLRIEDLAIKSGESNNVYPHLERPPLVFWLMSWSTEIWGDKEVAYRLPSLLFGILGLAGLVLVCFKRKTGWWGLMTGLIIMVCSYDWWMSAQMAHLDTALSFFLFFSLVFLLAFEKKRKTIFLILSGVGAGLALLSKGQIAALMFFPLAFLFLKKRIKMREMLIWGLSLFLITSGWFLVFIFKYGWSRWAGIYLMEMLSHRALIQDLSQKAPGYWYVRWWLDSLRPGWILFLIFSFYDFFRKRLNTEKLVLLSYILGGLLLFSISKNKVWWYVLPLIPALAFYVAIGVKDYLSDKKSGLLNLGLLFFLASYPAVLFSTDRQIAIYGAMILGFGFLILVLPLKLKTKKIEKMVFILALAFSYYFFQGHFPINSAGYPESKEIGSYFQSLEGEKCLWVEGVAYEGLMYYSRAGEINYYEGKKKKGCVNYLVSGGERKKEGLEKIYEFGRLGLFRF
jgi:4-amino-4-deoxy-L-arabinose transferase-like glycosyltransferase